MNKIILVLSIIWVSIACRKITPIEADVPPCPSSDYRAQFLGDYDCIVYGAYWDMDLGNSWDTTKSIIHITNGNQANTIMVRVLLPTHWQLNYTSPLGPANTTSVMVREYIIDSTGKMNYLFANQNDQGNGNFISSKQFNLTAAYYYHPHSGIRTIHGKRK